MSVFFLLQSRPSLRNYFFYFKLFYLLIIIFVITCFPLIQFFLISFSFISFSLVSFTSSLHNTVHCHIICSYHLVILCGFPLSYSSRFNPLHASSSSFFLSGYIFFLSLVYTVSFLSFLISFRFLESNSFHISAHLHFSDLT